MLLTEYTRQAIRRSVVKPQLNSRGELPAWLLDPALEQGIESSVEHNEQNSILTLAPQAIRELLNKVGRAVNKPQNQAILVTSSGARYFLRQMVEASWPNLTVLSHNEIPPGVKVLSLGVIQ